jgi:hypothetical protein
VSLELLTAAKSLCNRDLWIDHVFTISPLGGTGRQPHQQES